MRIRRKLMMNDFCEILIINIDPLNPGFNFFVEYPTRWRRYKNINEKKFVIVDENL